MNSTTISILVGLFFLLIGKNNSAAAASGNGTTTAGTSSNTLAQSLANTLANLTGNAKTSSSGGSGLGGGSSPGSGLNGLFGAPNTLSADSGSDALANLNSAVTATTAAADGTYDGSPTLTTTPVDDSGLIPTTGSGDTFVVSNVYDPGTTLVADNGDDFSDDYGD